MTCLTGNGHRFAVVPVVAFVVVCDLALTAGCEPPQSVDRAFVEEGSGAASVAGQAWMRRRPVCRPGPSAVATAPSTPVSNVTWGRATGSTPTVRGECFSNCTTAPACGDGTVNGPEECDDGPHERRDRQALRRCRGSATSSAADHPVLRRHAGDRARAVRPRSARTTTPPTAPVSAPRPACRPPSAATPSPTCARSATRAPSTPSNEKTWSLQGGGCNQTLQEDRPPLRRRRDRRARRAVRRRHDEHHRQHDLRHRARLQPGVQEGQLLRRRPPRRRRALRPGTPATQQRQGAGACVPGGCNRICGVIYRYCGDGYMEVGDEQCDLGPGRNTGAPGGCDARCRLVPRWRPAHLTACGCPWRAERRRPTMRHTVRAAFAGTARLS